MLPIFQTNHPILRFLPLRGNFMFLPPMFLPFLFKMVNFIQLLRLPKSIRRRFAMARQEKQQYVATCCRCVASGKGQRNPCKMGLVAVLPIKKR
jgi:hypothetical protein